MNADTGTLVSLTGYFFSSKVRLIDCGKDENELIDQDVCTEVFTNDK